MTHADDTDDDYIARIFPPADGWAIVRHALTRLALTFGGHDALARQRALGAVTVRALLVEWLRPLEQLARKLLFVMACALDVAPLAQRVATPRKTAPADAPRDTRYDDPNTWRVSFRVQPRVDRARDPAPSRDWRPAAPIERGVGYWLVERYIEMEAREMRRAAQGPCALRADQFMRRADYDADARERHGAAAPMVHDGFPIARRIEALLRVLADPAPHARKLAQRIAGAPAATAAAFTAPHDPTKTGPCPAGLALVDRVIAVVLRQRPDTS